MEGETKTVTRSQRNCTYARGGCLPSYEPTKRSCRQRALTTKRRPPLNCCGTPISSPAFSRPATRATRQGQNVAARKVRLSDTAFRPRSFGHSQRCVQHGQELPP